MKSLRRVEPVCRIRKDVSDGRKEKEGKGFQEKPFSGYLEKAVRSYGIIRK